MDVSPHPGRPADTVSLVTERLAGVRRSGAGWSARCPSHEDVHPSLSVTAADDGGVLIHCFAGCERGWVLAAIGLEERDLQVGGRRTAPATRRPAISGDRGPAGRRPANAFSLAELAAAKNLPVEFLREVGCDTLAGRGVRIPYYDIAGTLAAIRTRLALAGDRFRWRKGDHPLLYGLWRMTEMRKAGWLLLVEGESDCWTLWHHGLPALGIPGKGTWRTEWAEALSGLDVVVWQEPDAADLVERIARDLPDVRVMEAPVGFKDLSEAHVGGVDIAALAETVRTGAVASRGVRAARVVQGREEAQAGAQEVLAHPDPLELVQAEFRVQGYGGDLRPPLLAYLGATTRVLAQRRGAIPGHLLFMGPSSGGKNAAMQAALRLLPDDAVHVIDAGSPRVLIYDPAPLEHRVVVFAEADSMPGGEDNPAASAIRNLLQDGRLHYQVTVPDPATGRFTVQKIEKAGPTVLMTTSTRPLGPQLMTRLFTVEIPDEPGQVRAALAAQAALELDEPPPRNEALVAFQRYLGLLAPIDVVVPFAGALQASMTIEASGPRLLRDYPRILALIKATAAIRIAQRAEDRRGRLVASVDDYRAVHDVLADSFAASSGPSTRIRLTVEAVGNLTGASLNATATVTQVANHLGLSVPATWRRVQVALAGKWLVNDESRRSQTARLRPGEPLPSASSLPPPSMIAARHADVPRPTAPDFAIAPNPSPSRPVSTGLAAGQDRRPDLEEIAQTAIEGPILPAPILLNFGIFGDEEEWGIGAG